MILATQDKPFLPSDLEGKLAAAAELGFDAYEADGSLLLSRYDELAEASRRSGVPVVSVCGGYGGWIGDFDEARRRRALEDIVRILEAGSGLGIRGIVAPAAWGMFSLRLPPMTPPRSAEDDRKVLLDSLSVLDAAAERTGTWIYLEPLNRYEDHMINTLAVAADIIAAGSFRRVKIAADFYHMNIEEAHIEESLTAFAPYIGHVHLADSHRYQPGTGHLDFQPGFRALRATGYNGIFTVECRVSGDDPTAGYRASAVRIRSDLAAAGYGGRGSR